MAAIDRRGCFIEGRKKKSRNASLSSFARSLYCERVVLLLVLGADDGRVNRGEIVPLQESGHLAHVLVRTYDRRFVFHRKKRERKRKNKNIE